MVLTSPREYEEINVTGPISVERTDSISDVDRTGGGYGSVLLMGPTGSGKSSFIETLGLENSERISSSRLEGCTQNVTTYKMKNVTNVNGSTIYLVDSPGFADTKISMSAIVGMLQEWMKNNDKRIYFYYILYFIPITQVRMPGSQRQVIKTFQALIGNKQGEAVTIVTTMWDSVWGERATDRAEATYEQLEGEIWKEYIERGAQITRFHNTRDSALLILDMALRDGQNNLYNMEKLESRNPNDVPFKVNIYIDLQDRIQNLQSEMATTHSELAYANANDDQQLCDVLTLRLREANEYLIKFQEELRNFGPPPPGVHPPHLELSTSHVNEGENHHKGTNGEMALGSVGSDSGPLERITSENSHSGRAAPSPPQRVHSAQEPDQPRQTWLSRGRDLITCGCGGKAVEANHDV